MKSSRPSLAAVERRVLEERLRPPPRLTVSQWADRYMVLSPEGSFRVGAFSTDDAPYQREFMDACGDPRFPQVVGMWASQSGKTLTLNCVGGYFIDQDPAPILMLQPTEKMAEAWSKDRLAPMLRDVPRFEEKSRIQVARFRQHDFAQAIPRRASHGSWREFTGELGVATDSSTAPR
jgi:phage terminase large subunit GpA-like protein